MHNNNQINLSIYRNGEAKASELLEVLEEVCPCC